MSMRSSIVATCLLIEDDRSRSRVGKIALDSWRIMVLVFCFVLCLLAAVVLLCLSLQSDVIKLLFEENDEKDVK
jgi:hypothetical protein